MDSLNIPENTMPAFMVCSPTASGEETYVVRKVYGNSVDAYNALENGEIVVIEYGRIKLED